jgi:hypothetical protein
MFLTQIKVGCPIPTIIITADAITLSADNLRASVSRYPPLKSLFNPIFARHTFPEFRLNIEHSQHLIFATFGDYHKVVLKPEATLFGGVNFQLGMAMRADNMVGCVIRFPTFATFKAIVISVSGALGKMWQGVQLGCFRLGSGQRWQLRHL